MSSDHNHAHNHAAGANEKSLRIALALTASFLVVQVIAGLMTQSLALLSDAAHMFTDAAALAIALAAIQIAKRPADKRRTFGYHRFEILAAAFNAMLLFMVAIYIVIEAWQRIFSPVQIESTGMLVVAVLGLVVNLISMRLLSQGKDSSLNVKGAYLEVWADMLGSVGVIIGALVIRFTGWGWVDSVVAVLIGLWVLPRTWVLLKSSLNILLEGVPEDLDIDAVERTILAVPGVLSIHDLHVWSLTSGKPSLTVHAVVDPVIDAETEVVPAIRRALIAAHGIAHSTVQCERVPCQPLPWDAHFEGHGHVEDQRAESGGSGVAHSHADHGHDQNHDHDHNSSASQKRDH
ncbi:cation diffusion facilitator family transporter [Pigmentiphaga aceris]|uniref:Cation diffusion facilitator family transporter n=1 Tax=Pigmentiphaga aceris TaxID=1940612 RepID=A0A5C0AYP6_9BURK|nr:cation diffusion facilitator family transporter [Pigmentiphaga aceris]QEI07325.1 cation diffusion facilitator family transporter [Pigmentiphaga aceris]